MKILFCILFLAFGLTACGTPPQNSPAENTNTLKPLTSANNTQPTPVPTNTQAKDGDYNGKGKITKIDNTLNSVELDHEEIPGLMPKMVMEFFVADKAMLSGLAVGDDADFVIRYNKGTETIVSIKKVSR